MDPKNISKKIKALREHGYTEEEATKIQIAAKKQKLNEETVAGTSSQSNQSYANVSKQFEMIISHKNHPADTLDDAALSLLIKALHNELDQEATKTIKFTRLNIDMNRLRISCKDIESKRWLVEKIDHVDTHKILQVSDMNSLPKMRYISIKFADPQTETKVILTRIKKQNPELNTAVWNVMSDVVHPDGDRIITLQIDLASLEVIQKNRFRLFCGFQELYVKRVHNFTKPDIPEMNGLSLDKESDGDKDEQETDTDGESK